MSDPVGKTPVELDGQHRIGLSQQQSDAGVRNPEPDQPGSRRPAAGVERPGRHPLEEPAKPAVSVKKSMTPEYLVCLEDGKRFKSLKRHLRTQYNMTPEQYRDKWGLPADYPMVAPNYAVARSQLAKKMGLGQQARKRK
jgi:predicted transcriptional regulator